MSRPNSRIETRLVMGRWSAWLGRLPYFGSMWQRMLEKPKELERFLKFAVVGIIGAAVDFTVLNLCKQLFEAVGLGEGWAISIEPHQIQLALANTISFSAAVLSNFTWNRLWTFPESRERAIAGQLAKFSVVNVLGLVINTVILLVMDQYVFQHLVGDRLSYNLAKAFAIGIVLFWNFAVNRIWTYRGIE